MNIPFTKQFKYWYHDGKNYSLDADNKTMRYEHTSNSNISARVELIKYQNTDKYIAFLVNEKTNKIKNKSKMTSNKDEAFNELSNFMMRRDNSEGEIQH